MLPLAQQVLAAMVYLIAPGHSPYSLVTVDTCDSTCQATPLCQPATKLVCRAPWWSSHHKSFVRQENYVDGLKRYGTIAKVVAALSESMTWQKVDGCSPYGKGATAECKLLRKSRPWIGSTAELRRTVLTTMYRESGFRRDVHSGVGPAARGDCKTDAHGQIIPGTCRSHCLGQVLMRAKTTPVDGYTKDQLVGMSLPATGRCLRATIRELSMARRYCAGSAGRAMAGASTCVFMVYVGTSNPKDGRIRARASTYAKLAKAPTKLKDSDKKILGL